jgi:hypothetical protein
MTADESFNIGNYDTEEEAALAYDWAARILFGPDAELNFPDELVSAGAAYMIRKSAGNIFGVEFRKRSDGSIRRLECRIVYPPGPYRFAEYNLIVVEEAGRPGYKCIPIEGITKLHIDGKSYSVRP